MLLVIGTLIVLATGGISALVYRKVQGKFPTRLALIAGALATLVIISPATVLIGTSVAKADAMRFDEFWNGYETQALADRTQCDRDGMCSHTYQCDPYTVPVTKTRSVYTGSDSKGTPQYRTETYVEIETHYHSCPYATEEWTYKVTTTLDDYTVASHIFSANPREWRPGMGIPRGVQQGEPASWVAVRNRLNAGDPGAVTAVRHYENYILASQGTILKRYSADMDRYKAANALPTPAKDAPGLQANKAYGVNIKLDKGWAQEVNRFNGALGTDLRGDLHLVVTKNITEADAYSGALMAYWQSPELKRKAISKNSLVVVLGTTDGKTISWARAMTGMPAGNEALLQEIQTSLKGKDLNPQTILGAPKAKLTGNKSKPDIQIVHTHGILEDAVWGKHRFERVEMADSAYLKNQIQPSTGAKTTIMILVMVLSATAWVLAYAFLAEQANRPNSQNGSANPYRGINNLRQRTRL